MLVVVKLYQASEPPRACGNPDCWAPPTVSDSIGQGVAWEFAFLTSSHSYLFDEEQEREYLKLRGRRETPLFFSFFPLLSQPQPSHCPPKRKINVLSCKPLRFGGRMLCQQKLTDAYIMAWQCCLNSDLWK